MDISERKDFGALLAFGAITGLVSVLGGLFDIGLSAVLGGADISGLPFFLALGIAHREWRPAFAILAVSVAAIGTAVFVAGNAAFPIQGLAGKYYTVVDEAGRQAIAAAGEALLSRGAHGSPGAVLGIAGSSIMILYLIAVTFIPDMEHVAMFVVMLGGLATMAWLILASIRLFGLGMDHAKA